MTESQIERLITTLPGIDDIELIKPVPVVLLEEEDGSFLSEVRDARIHYGGDSIEDAVDSMRDYLVGSFRLLSKMADAQLGPSMIVKRDVLLTYFRWCNRA